jgi:uncharacterized protein YprB with RNaseH-like and TPR domain
LNWTPTLDRRALSLAEQDQSAATIALQFSADGLTVSEDAVRNRLRRLRNAQERIEAEPVIPETDEHFDTPEPADGYVGLRHAYWDTESTGLTAIMGRMLAAAVADSWGNVTVRRVDEFAQKSRLDDSGLCQWYRDELEQSELLISWNGFGHDVPLLNARLLRWGKRPLGQRMQVDAMWKAGGGRYGARIGSRKLDNVAKFFHIAEAKTPLDWETWQLAGMGDEAAMAEIVEHNVADVLVTRAVFNHLKPLIRTIHT